MRIHAPNCDMRQIYTTHVRYDAKCTCGLGNVPNVPDDLEPLAVEEIGALMCVPLTVATYNRLGKPKRGDTVYVGVDRLGVRIFNDEDIGDIAGHRMPFGDDGAVTMVPTERLEELLSASGSLVRMCGSNVGGEPLKDAALRLHRAMEAIDVKEVKPPPLTDKSEDVLTELVLNEAIRQCGLVLPNACEQGDTGKTVCCEDALMRSAFGKPRNWSTDSRKRVVTIMHAAGWQPCVGIYPRGNNDKRRWTAWKPPVPK